MFIINPYVFGGSAEYFLDEYSPEICFSLHRVQATETDVVRVRRDSDNAESDFTATEISDGTLVAWTGANNGFVVTMYNLGAGGSTYDATQSTAGDQPKIVDSSTGVLTVPQNGNLALLFDGTRDFLQLGSAWLTTTTFTEVHAFNRASSGISSIVFGYTGSTTPYTSFWFTDNKTYFKPTGGATVGSWFTPDTSSGDFLDFISYSSNSALLYRNNVASGDNPLSHTHSTSNRSLDKFGARSTTKANGYKQFYCVFETDENANRTEIQDYINDALSIY